MGSSTCLRCHCGASIAGLREKLVASRSGPNPLKLSIPGVDLHDKGPPFGTLTSSLPASGNGRYNASRRSDAGVARGVRSVRCQAAASVQEKVHLSTSSHTLEDGSASSLPYSVLLEQGPREEMEDEAVVLGNAHNGYVYAGVYDGHAGSAAVHYLREHLHLACIKATERDNGAALNASDSATVALETAFLETDAALLKELSTITGAEGRSGSTGTAAFVRKDKIVVAYVGDSRVVLCRGKRAMDLSGDHRPWGKTPSSMSEVKRLREAGCWINHGRVCGMLAVSRAFGDPLYKNDRPIMLEEGLKKRRFTQKFVDRIDLSQEWVLAKPEVTLTQTTEEDQFVLMASDGLWDAIKSQEAIDFVLQRFEKGDDLQVTTQELGKFALREKGADNISIVLIDLRGRSGAS